MESTVVFYEYDPVLRRPRVDSLQQGFRTAAGKGFMGRGYRVRSNHDD